MEMHLTDKVMLQLIANLARIQHTQSKALYVLPKAYLGKVFAEQILQIDGGIVNPEQREKMENSLLDLKVHMADMEKVFQESQMLLGEMYEEINRLLGER